MSSVVTKFKFSKQTAEHFQSDKKRGNMVLGLVLGAIVLGLMSAAIIIRILNGGHF